MAVEVEDYKVEFAPAAKEPFWKRWLRGFPQNFFIGFYNTCVFFRHRELREPMKKGQCPMRWIRSFPSLIFSPLTLKKRI